MNSLQKKFVIRTALIFLLTIILAWNIKSIGDLYTLPIFLHLFARYDLPAAVLLIIILLIGMLLALKTKERWTDRCLIFIGNNPFRIAVSVFIVLSIGAYFIYCRYPLCRDESMPFFQARIFAEGRLWGQFPPKLVPWLLRPGFFSVYSTETGRVVSDYWPGFALLLTPFMKLGVPWLLNPIISSGTLLLLFYYMKKIIVDNVAASSAMLLTISSAVFIVSGISYYSMSAQLFFNLLYAVCLLRISPLRLFLAGLVGSFALILSNPIPHFAFALPWIVWIGLKKNRCRNISVLFAGYLPVSLFVGIGWVWLKLFIARGGIAMASNYGADSAQSIQSQVHAVPLKDAYLLPEFMNRVSELIRGNFKFPSSELLWARLVGFLKLFAWSIPGLPILAVMGIRYTKGAPHLKLWGWSATLTLFIYFFVQFDQGHGWGFRYFHSAWLALPILSAAFLTATELKEAAFWKRYICIASLLSLVFCTSLRLFQVHQFIEQHLSKLPVLEKNIKYICIMNTEQGYYTQDLVQNDPFLREPAVILRSIDNLEDSKMMKALFPKAIKIKQSLFYTIWKIGDNEVLPKIREGV
jgi:hypothetical protein